MAYATCTDPSCPHGRRNLALRRAADLGASAASQAVADGRTIMKLRRQVANFRALINRQATVIDSLRRELRDA